MKPSRATAFAQNRTKRRQSAVIGAKSPEKVPKDVRSAFCVYDGRTLLGRVEQRGRLFTVFDASDKRLGNFSSRKAALAAIDTAATSERMSERFRAHSVENGESNGC